MNKSFLTILAVLSLLLAACAQAPASKTGRAVFAITDAAADMGAVTSVKVTIDSVEAHSTTAGWTTVSSAQKTYDLLQLKTSGDTVTMADVQLNPGTYEQVRLVISKVEVTDSNGTHEAKLPSGELKIVGGFNVTANTTSAITFDFIADRSLHVTGSGKYILAPVVHVTATEGSEIEDRGEGKVEIRNGHVKTDIEVGMDENGEVGEDNKLEADEELEIEDGKIIKGLGVSANASGKIKVSG